MQQFRHTVSGGGGWLFRGEAYQLVARKASYVFVVRGLTRLWPSGSSLDHVHLVHNCIYTIGGVLCCEIHWSFGIPDMGLPQSCQIRRFIAIWATFLIIIITNVFITPFTRNSNASRNFLVFELMCSKFVKERIVFVRATSYKGTSKTRKFEKF